MSPRRLVVAVAVCIALVWSTFAELGIGAAEVQPSRLGVSVVPVDAEIARQYGGTPNQGVLITHVFPQSAAASMDLRPGDILIEFAGRPVNSRDELVRVLNEVGIVGRRALELIRDGQHVLMDADYRPPAGMVGEQETRTVRTPPVRQTRESTPFDQLEVLSFRGITPGVTDQAELSVHPNWGPPRAREARGGYELWSYTYRNYQVTVLVADELVQAIDLRFPARSPIPQVVQIFGLGEPIESLRDKIPPEAQAGTPVPDDWEVHHYGGGRGMLLVDPTGPAPVAAMLRFYGNPVGTLAEWGTSIYRNAEFGFEIELPPFRAPPDAFHRRATVRPPYEVNAEHLPNVSLSYQTVSGATVDLLEQLASSQQPSQQLGQAVTLVSQKRLSLNGQTGLLLDFSFDAGGRVMRQQRCMVPQNQQILSLVLSAATDDLPGIEERYRESLNSLRLGRAGLLERPPRDQTFLRDARYALTWRPPVFEIGGPREITVLLEWGGPAAQDAVLTIEATNSATIDQLRDTLSKATGTVVSRFEPREIDGHAAAWFEMEQTGRSRTTALAVLAKGRVLILGFHAPPEFLEPQKAELESYLRTARFY